MNQGYVHELFSEAAALHGGRVAVEGADGRGLTYRELDDEANNLANYLLAEGAVRGAMVAVVAEATASVVTAILACLKAGAVFVPLDPRLPARRLATLLNEVKPAWVIAEPAHLPTLAQLPEGAVASADVLCLGCSTEDAPGPAGLRVREDFADFRDTRPVSVERGPDEMCYVYFTSGSTGTPKGIAGRLKSIDHFIRWEVSALGLGEGVRVSQLTTPSFDAYLRDVFVPLCTGGTVCAGRGREALLDARGLAAWLNESRVNVLHCVPSVFRALSGEALKTEDFPDLRYVLMAGEPLLPADVKRWMSVFGGRVRLVNLYGPTETTMVKFFHFVTEADQHRRAVPIGKPMEGAKAILIDARGRLCGVGTVGEIHIRTPYRTLGYLNRPDLTSEVFLPNPFTQDPQDIIYKTGDLGRMLEDGSYEFLGRKDQQVKIRGARVELREIEDALLGHEAVRDVAVTDRDDAEGTKYLCAYVVPGGETTTVALREHLTRELPDYMVPSAFVMMDELPRTITGKVDRRVLPSPEQARADAGREYVAPRTPVEEVLCGIWSQVLGLERVGVGDNFFELGGHSLLVTRLLSRVRAALDVDLPMRSLFASPTVAELAQRVEEARHGGRRAALRPLAPVGRDRALPLAFAQQRLWFLQQLEPESPFYNMQSAIRIAGALDTAALARAIREIVRRHEIMRTAFVVRGDEPAQEVAHEVDLELPLVEVQGAGEVGREDELHGLMLAEAGGGFDLARGPLYRFKLFRLSADEHILNLVMHHIISDAWSIGVFARELAALYEAFTKGEPSPLPELPVQYADYAAWQREWLEGEQLAAQLDFWRGAMAGAPALVELPADRPRPAAQTFRGALHPCAVPAELTAAVKDLARREGATLFMTLLAAFKALLHSFSGQTRVVVGTDFANRPTAETEELIGFFINQLPIPTDLSGDPTFRELLGRVRDVAFEVYAHQDVPFEKLVEAINPARSPQYAPLVQAKLVLQNVPVPTVEIAGLTFSAYEVERRTAQLDLILNLTETPRGVEGFVEYNTDLFSAGAVARLVGNLQSLLEIGTARRDVRLSELAQELAALDRARREQQEVELAAANLSKIRQARRRPVGAPARQT